MTEEDRLNNSKCTFPLAMAFGDRDMFASSNGAETILENAKKWNDGQVNLFKMKKGSHNFPLEFPEETARCIIGHFDGSIKNNWDPTVYGDYQWHDD
jgi:pimeloyl-ACP methyl ester carboxylesterase